MIKSLFVILTAGGLSIYYSDLDSESSFSSILLPIIAVISLIALALWLVTFFHNRGINQTIKSSARSGIDFFSDSSGGGDGG